MDPRLQPFVSAEPSLNRTMKEAQRVIATAMALGVRMPQNQGVVYGDPGGALHGQTGSGPGGLFTVTELEKNFGYNPAADAINLDFGYFKHNADKDVSAASVGLSLKALDNLKEQPTTRLLSFLDETLIDLLAPGTDPATMVYNAIARLPEVQKSVSAHFQLAS